jgi:hypothetical protein
MTKRIRALLAMSTRWIRLWGVLAAFALLLVFAGLVVAAVPTGQKTAGPVRDDAYPGASKELVFTHTRGNCSTGLTAGTPTDSFAVINTHHGNVSTEVSLKGLEPNTTYQLDLVQTPSGESCLQDPGETSLRTNGQGNGNAHWSEPIRPGQTGVFVMLITDLDTLATPTVPLG